MALGCGLASAILVNHSLDVAARGRLAQFQATSTGLAVALGLSLESSTYHTADPRRYHQTLPDKGITLLAISTALIGICAVVLALLNSLSPSWFQSMRSWVPALFAWSAAQIVQSHAGVFLQASGRLVAVARVSTLQTALGFIALLYLFGIGQLDVAAAVWVWAVRQVLGALLLLFLVVRLGVLGGRFDPPLAVRLLGTGLQMHLATVAAFVYTGMNQMTLAYYCGEQEAGYYAVALTLISACMTLPEAFLQVLYPRVIHHQDEYEVTLRTLRYGFYGWGLLVAAIGALAQPILALYGGSRFQASLQPFLLLLPMLWLLPLSSLMSPYLVKVGAFRLMSVTAVSMGILSVFLNRWLIPAHSYNGAAVANSVCAITGFAVCLLQLSLCTGRNALDFLKARN